MSQSGQVDLVFISYESGNFASCPAEWADDKADSLEKLGLRTVLVTNLASAKQSTIQTKVLRVPSLSYQDFSGELKSFMLLHGEIPTWLRLYSFVPNTFGRLFDFLFSRLAGNLGWGRWSWTVSAAFVALNEATKNKSSRILASGGPSAAHLAAVIVGKLAHRKVALEFQDPFIGTEMVMSALAWRVIRRLEGFLIKGADRISFVTKKACEEVQVRYPLASQRIFGIYPGAPILNSQEKPIPAPWPKDKIVLLHLGTLYGDRNFDKLFKALDSLYDETPKFKGKFLAVNLGNLYLPNVDEYSNRDDYLHLEPIPREAALVLAKQADCLLLIQHLDSRSQATIPYKTYDYLNLGVPVLGLLNNPELSDLLVSHGGVAISNSDVSAIRTELKELATSKARKTVISPTGLDPVKQAALLLGIE